MPLKTRKPTGLAPWPFILVEGAEKTGKSYLLAKFSADARIADTYWIDCGEGAADQYGALPGARYQVVDHDGSYSDISNQVAAFVAEIPGIDPVTGKPNVLVFDSATNLWTTIKNNAQAEANRRKGKRDAQVTMDLWNKAREQWKAIVDPLIGWSGIVIFTARGKEVTAMDDAGKPLLDEKRRVVKEYTFESHKTLSFDVDVILRTLSPGVAMLTGARSALDISSYLDQPFTGLDLEVLLFDYLKLGQKPAGTRDLRTAAPETADDEVTEHEAKVAVFKAVGKDKARAAAAWAASDLSGDSIAKSALAKLLGELAEKPATEAPTSLPTNEDGSVNEKTMLGEPQEQAA